MIKKEINVCRAEENGKEPDQHQSNCARGKANRETAGNTKLIVTSGSHAHFNIHRSILQAHFKPLNIALGIF